MLTEEESRTVEYAKMYVDTSFEASTIADLVSIIDRLLGHTPAQEKEDDR
jgi:hypothetical protein